MQKQLTVNRNKRDIKQHAGFLATNSPFLPQCQAILSNIWCIIFLIHKYLVFLRHGKESNSINSPQIFSIFASWKRK